MNNLEEKILKTINENNLIENGDKIVLAVSGGPDSIAMLNSLNNIKANSLLNFEIFVAHVNHMIREEAGEDEQFVKDFCKKIDVQFFSKSIDVKLIANNNKIGLEEAGRIARYDFFDEVQKMTSANKIAIAHNKNDSVETVIMHALRGSGTYGLHGIEAINGKYIRPLIECEREEIEQYCKENNIEARIDKTNFENLYTRNKVRNVAIPYVKKEFNPNIIETISRLSDLIKQQDEFVDEFVENAFEDIKVEEDEKQIVLNLKMFNLQNKVIKSKLILYTIIRLFGTSKGIEKIHIDDIIKLCENNIGNKFLTPNKNIKVLIKNKKIYFLKLS
ncbi:MAG: tRNA lysidine(34) synthetase TilS [Clostridia bacterium]|nr:tRNA lysidine(34) synthetase TilS [Clostridia bacterium]